MALDRNKLLILKKVPNFGRPASEVLMSLEYRHAGSIALGSHEEIGLYKYK
jgi:hypothetical protein